MSQTALQNHEDNLLIIKHPWQPDWVSTKQDVDIFLKLMDHYQYLVEDERDWYPPFLVFLEKINGKVMVGSILSKWHLSYDPLRAGKQSPIEIIRANGVEV